eukprot:585846-Rhodomonas_salina.3
MKRYHPSSHIVETLPATRPNRQTSAVDIARHVFRHKTSELRCVFVAAYAHREGASFSLHSIFSGREGEKGTEMGLCLEQLTDQACCRQFYGS